MKLSNKTAKGWLQFIPAGTRLCKIIHWRVVTVQDFHACSNFLSVWFKTEWFFYFLLLFQKMVYFYRSSSFFSQVIVSSFPLQCNCVQVWPCRGALVEFYVLIYCTSTLPEAVEQKKTISRFLDTYLNFVYNFLKKLLGGLLHIPTRGSL